MRVHTFGGRQIGVDDRGNDVNIFFFIHWNYQIFKKLEFNKKNRQIERIFFSIREIRFFNLKKIVKLKWY